MRIGCGISTEDFLRSIRGSSINDDMFDFVNPLPRDILKATCEEVAGIAASSYDGETNLVHKKLKIVHPFPALDGTNFFANVVRNFSECKRINPDLLGLPPRPEDLRLQASVYKFHGISQLEWWHLQFRVGCRTSLIDESSFAGLRTMANEVLAELQTIGNPTRGRGWLPRGGRV